MTIANLKNGVIFLDTETTGIGAKDEVIEIAYIPVPENTTFASYMQKVVKAPSEDITLFHFVEQFYPSVPINPHAEAVHGLTKGELVGFRPSKRAASTIPEKVKYIIGHNIGFDYRMLRKPEGYLLIDTLKLTRLLRKLGKVINEGKGNDKLDNLIGFYYPQEKETISKYHDALGDCRKVVLLLLAYRDFMPNVETWDDLYKIAGIEEDEK